MSEFIYSTSTKLLRVNVVFSYPSHRSSFGSPNSSVDAALDPGESESRAELLSEVSGERSEGATAMSVDWNNVNIDGEPSTVIFTDRAQTDADQDLPPDEDSKLRGSIEL